MLSVYLLAATPFSNDGAIGSRSYRNKDYILQGKEADARVINCYGNTKCGALLLGGQEGYLIIRTYIGKNAHETLYYVQERNK